MKRKLCWRCIVLIVSMVFSLPVSHLAAQGNHLQPGPAMGRNVPVPIRAEQSASSEALGTLERGELLTVIDIDGVWAQVEYGDLAGWALKAQLVNSDAPQPGPLGFAYMAHDSESNRLVLFGGEDFIAEPIFQDDTWTYDTDANRWAHMRPEQAPLGGGSVAYDAQSDRLILFVGATGLPEKLVAGTWATQTWAYDLNTDTWQNMQPTTVPLPTLGAGMAYDAESDRMILFGGADPLRLAQGHFFSNETWAYDYETNSWTEMHPAVSPPGRSFFAVAYDALADRVILFGGGIAVVGNNGFNLAGDTWSYDYNTDTWEEQVTAESPLPRVFTAMAYDSKRHHVTLFGGANPFQGKAFGDTWAYDSKTNSWTELSPGTSPSERAWHTMAYDSLADRIVLFGGGTDLVHFTMETWLYDPEANTWTQVGP